MSLPRLEDVRGYEEKDARVLERMQAGYPRFRRHPWIVEAENRLPTEPGYRNVLVLAGVGPDFLFRKAEAQRVNPSRASGALDWPAVEAAEWLRIPNSHQAWTRLREVEQHAGMGLSPRQAARLLRRPIAEDGPLPPPEPRAVDKRSEPCSIIESHVREAGAWADGHVADLAITPTGMSALAGIVAGLDCHSDGRWLLAGWLYCDTPELCRMFGSESPPLCVYSEDDLDRAIAQGRLDEAPLRGILTEVPTNPLLQTFDLERLRALAHRHQVPLVVDVSSAGIWNVDAGGLADIVTGSLTKYAAWRANAMGGFLALMDHAPLSETERGRILRLAGRLDAADAAVLAAQIPVAPQVTSLINANARIVAEYLREHPAIDRVWAPHLEAQGLQREGGGPGSLISFTLRTAMEPVYDRLPILKSPSFGAAFTSCCPYLWLAHYPIVCDPKGRAQLQSMGIPPDLLRLSVGTEDAAQILQALEEGLRG